jgi:transcriptional regulator PpsR
MITSASASIPFRSPESALGALDADVTARALAASSDATLIVDGAGRVVDLSVGSGELANVGVGDWLDKPWIELVAPDSRQKAEELFEDAVEGRSARWRELNHPTAAGGNLPMRWFALPAGPEGRVMLVGRDLQAAASLQQRLLQVQQSMERDYARLRQSEARWRLLFQTGAEPILVVDAATRRVREGNPAGWRLLGVGEEQANGRLLADLLAPESAETLGRLFAGSGGSGSAEVVLQDGSRCFVAASLFRQDRASLFLVRFTPSDGRRLDPETQADLRLARVLDRIPDAFVVTDRSLRILAANPAFADAIGLSVESEALGEPLDRFLGRPQIDLKVILAQLEEHGSIRNVSTVLRSAYGQTEEVEVTAVSAPDADPPSYGFSLRLVARRLNPAAWTAAPEGPRSVEQMTQLIGRVPMKEIVRESTELIERLCIEAALTLTGNNRASAADLLGLSRQSLYLKLRRYGVIGPEASEE